MGDRLHLTSIRLPVDLHAELRAAALEDRRTVTWEIVEILTKWMESRRSSNRTRRR